MKLKVSWIRHKCKEVGYLVPLQTLKDNPKFWNKIFEEGVRVKITIEILK